MNHYFSSEKLNLMIQTAFLIAVLVLLYIIYRYIFAWAGRKALKTEGTLDDHMVKLFRGPVLWIMLWFVLNIFVQLFYSKVSFYPILLKINNLLLIFSLALVSSRFVSAGAYYLQMRYDLGSADKFRARKSLTQVKVFKAIAVTVIVIIAIGAALMTFEQARRVGISVLTSAGIMGIIVGFALKKAWE
jgi:small-conductance mechanosensitive channel